MKGMKSIARAQAISRLHPFLPLGCVPLFLFSFDPNVYPIPSSLSSFIGFHHRYLPLHLTDNIIINGAAAVRD